MTTAKLIRLLTILLLLAGQVTAQYGDELRRQEQEDRQREALENALSIFENDYSDFVEGFLPTMKKAWTISITRSGGIGGNKSELLLLANSMGLYSCGFKAHSYDVRLIDLDALSRLEGLVRSSNLRSLEKSFKAPGTFCSDCYVTNMKIAYRTKPDKKKQYEFSWSLFPETAKGVSSIFDEVRAAAGCG